MEEDLNDFYLLLKVAATLGRVDAAISATITPIYRAAIDEAASDEEIIGRYIDLLQNLLTEELLSALESHTNRFVRGRNLNLVETALSQLLQGVKTRRLGRSIRLLYQTLVVQWPRPARTARSRHQASKDLARRAGCIGR